MAKSDEIEKKVSSKARKETKDDLKSKLEIQKLDAEIKHLNKSYFSRVILPVLIPSLITALGTFGTILILYKSLISSENEKRIDNIYKNNKLLLETYELTKNKDALNKSIEKDKIEKQKIKDSISILSKELSIQDTENKKLKGLTSELKDERDKLQTQVRQIPDTVAKKLIVKYIDDIDSQPEFYYTKNFKSYSKFGKVINGASSKIYNQIIEKYINDEKNPWQNRMYVIMVAYNYSNNKRSLTPLIQQNIDKEICSENRNKEFYIVLSCKEWNDDFYHSLITYSLQKSIDFSCSYNFFSVFNNLRTDLKFSPTEDPNSFFLYLGILKQHLQKKDGELRIYDIQKFGNIKYVSLNLRKIALSEFIVNNEQSFLKLVNEIQADPKKRNPSQYISQSQLKMMYEKFEINEENFKSLDYWKSINIENKSLLNRLQQDDFKTYRKNINQLIEDIQ